MMAAYSLLMLATAPENFYKLVRSSDELADGTKFIMVNAPRRDSIPYPSLCTHAMSNATTSTTNCRAYGIHVEPTCKDMILNVPDTIQVLELKNNPNVEGCYYIMFGEKYLVNTTSGKTSETRGLNTRVNPNDTTATWNINISADNNYAAGMRALCARANNNIGFSSVNGGLFNVYENYSNTVMPVALFKQVPYIDLESISLPEMQTISMGYSVQLTATVMPLDASVDLLFWTSDHPEIASVESNGLVHANKAGTATITAYSFDSTVTASCVLTVDPTVFCPVTDIAQITSSSGRFLISYPAESVAADNNRAGQNRRASGIHIQVGNIVDAISDTTQIFVLEPTTGGYYIKADGRYLVGKRDAANPQLLTRVSPDGQPAVWNFSFNIDGTANIVNTDESLNYNKITYKNGYFNTYLDGKHVTLYAEVPPVEVTGITLEQPAKTDLAAGLTPETVQLVAAVQPADATNKTVIYTSSNTDVVTVSETGLVTAVGRGTATVTATAAGNTAYKQTVDFTVRQLVTSITLDVTELNFTQNQDAIFSPANALVTIVEILPADADNKEVTWTSSNTAIVLAGSGHVSPVGLGNATITVAAADGGGAAAVCTVSVVYQRDPEPVPEGLLDTQTDDVRAVKTMVGGQLIIERGGRKYNSLGAALF